MRTSTFLQAPKPLAAGLSRKAVWGRTVSAPSNGSRVQATVGNWFPGSDCPAHLTDDLIGNYGYDPLGLSVEPGNLARMRECEVINGRWAMLGVVGSLTVEILGLGNWYTGPSWVKEGGTATYLGNPIPFDIKTLAAIELVLMGGAEALRGGEPDLETRIYPGGAFDPFGFSKGDKAKLDELKLKEIKNGRLAMFAMLGFYFQYYATGKGPVECWTDHIADPLGANFATNGVSIPFF
eukprot:evm.model.scf_1801.4 EVM.evm.TU.scf_1801.4   scf_1801:24369-26356(+)